MLWVTVVRGMHMQLKAQDCAVYAPMCVVSAALLSSPLLSACRKHCELEKDPRRMTSVLMSVLEQIKVGWARRCGHVGGAGNVLVHVYLQSFPSLLSLPLPSPTFSKLLQLLCTYRQEKATHLCTELSSLCWITTVL